MNKNQVYTLTSILLGFFVMGFCDLVGIATSHIKIDFNLNDTISNLIPFVLFIMFFIFSIPTSLLMNRIGRKRTVLISYLLTIIALIIPIINYSFLSCLVCFALLGIANTILQVSLNPLLVSFINKDKQTAGLTTGQFIKAISSFSAPILTSFFAIRFGDWKLIFMAFAATTALSAGLLSSISSNEKQPDNINDLKISNIFGLLKNKIILLLFFGIVCVVGIDVGMNVMIPKILMENNITNINNAAYGSSLYFFGRTLGMLLGIFLFLKARPVKVFSYCVITTLICLTILFFTRNSSLMLVLFCVIGMSVANIFPIILSIAMNIAKNINNVSGLMITGVVGGAIIPIIMGINSDLYGSQSGSVITLFLAAVYLLICLIVLKNNYLNTTSSK